MLFWLSVVIFITSSVYTVISGNPGSHAEYLVDSVNPVPKQVPRNCRNSKWSSLTWHLAHSASAFVTNQLIWISLNQRANSTWWGRTRKVWRRTRHKVGANSIGGERGAIRAARPFVVKCQTEAIRSPLEDSSSCRILLIVSLPGCKLLLWECRNEFWLVTAFKIFIKNQQLKLVFRPTVL